MQYHVLQGNDGFYIIVDDNEISQSEIHGHSQAWWYRHESFGTELEAQQYMDELIAEDNYAERACDYEWFASLSEEE